jgi:hypothetical protein
MRSSGARFSAVIAGVAAALLVLSCDEPGTAPAAESPKPFMWRWNAGRYVLDFRGNVFRTVGSRLEIGCSGMEFWTMYQFTNLLTDVDLTYEADRWVARPTTPAGGHFEIVFDPAVLVDTGMNHFLRVEGTVRGTMIATRIEYPRTSWRPDSVTFGPGSSGVVARMTADDKWFLTGSLADGSVTGDIEAHRSTGERFPCAGIPSLSLRTAGSILTELPY